MPHTGVLVPGFSQEPEGSPGAHARSGSWLGERANCCLHPIPRCPLPSGPSGSCLVCPEQAPARGGVRGVTLPARSSLEETSLGELLPGSILSDSLERRVERSESAGMGVLGDPRNAPWPEPAAGRSALDSGVCVATGQDGAFPRRCVGEDGCRVASGEPTGATVGLGEPTPEFQPVPQGLSVEPARAAWPQPARVRQVPPCHCRL